MTSKLVVTVLLVSIAAPLQAAQQAAEPEILTRVSACRAISASEDRLACFDREVAALEAAQATQELVIVDRRQVRKARRSLFGLSLPDLSIFGDDNEDAETVSRIEGKIQHVGRDGSGKWILVLEDGARWVQVDSTRLTLDPEPGQLVSIRKASLGSYFANIDGQRAIRMRRDR